MKSEKNYNPLAETASGFFIIPSSPRLRRAFSGWMVLFLAQAKWQINWQRADNDLQVELQELCS